MSKLFVLVMAGGRVSATMYYASFERFLTDCRIPSDEVPLVSVRAAVASLPDESVTNHTFSALLGAVLKRIVPRANSPLSTNSSAPSTAIRKRDSANATSNTANRGRRLGSVLPLMQSGGSSESASSADLLASLPLLSSSSSSSSAAASTASSSTNEFGFVQKENLNSASVAPVSSIITSPLRVGSVAPKSLAISSSSDSQQLDPALASQSISRVVFIALLVRGLSSSTWCGLILHLTLKKHAVCFQIPDQNG